MPSVQQFVRPGGNGDVERVRAPTSILRGVQAAQAAAVAGRHHGEQRRGGDRNELAAKLAANEAAHLDLNAADLHALRVGEKRGHAREIPESDYGRNGGGRDRQDSVRAPERASPRRYDSDEQTDSDEYRDEYDQVDEALERQREGIGEPPFPPTAARARVCGFDCGR
jgi:hypothetical protein